MIAPAEPTVEGVEAFLLKRMQIPEEVVKDLEINNVKKTHPKNLPIHRQSTDAGNKVKQE